MRKRKGRREEERYGERGSDPHSRSSRTTQLCCKPGLPVADALVGAQVFLQQRRDSAVDVGTNASGKI